MATRAFATDWKAVLTVLLYCAAADLHRRHRSAFPRQQGAALEHRLADRRRGSRPVPAGREQAGQGQALAPVTGAERDLRQHVCGGDADLGRGRVQQRLIGLDVRPLLHEVRGQRDRQVRPARSAPPGRWSARCSRPAARRGRRRPGCAAQQLLLQRRQGRHAAARLACCDSTSAWLTPPSVEAVLRDVHCLPVQPDDVLRGGDLRLERCLGQRATTRLAVRLR